MTDAAVRFCMLCGKPVTNADPSVPPAPCGECAQAAVPRTSALAVASFLMGLMGCIFPVAPLLAIGYGITALRRIRRSGGTLAGAPWAWWGIGLGLAWVLLVITLFVLDI